jgi:hypothetical protein
MVYSCTRDILVIFSIPYKTFKRFKSSNKTLLYNILLKKTLETLKTLVNGILAIRCQVKSAPNSYVETLETLRLDI